MITMLQTVTTVARALTAGQLFPSQSGAQLAIAYHQQVMPDRGRDITPDLMPFCLVKARGFSLFPGRSQQIELIYALHNEDRAEALADLSRLSGLLDPLAVRGQQYQGWKLGAVTGYPGDKENGVQPHPEYYLTVVMDFIAPAIN